MEIFFTATLPTTGAKASDMPNVLQRPSKQIVHFNEAGENLEREVAMTVDAYFDTFDDFDICDWLLTLEANGSVQDA